MFEEFLVYLFSLLPAAPEIIGWGGLVGFIINILKLFLGEERMDGKSALISLGMNAVLLIVLWFGGEAGFRAQFEEVVGQLGVALPAVFALFVAAGGSKLAHLFMKWLDEQKFSFSARNS